MKIIIKMLDLVLVCSWQNANQLKVCEVTTKTQNLILHVNNINAEG